MGIEAIIRRHEADRDSREIARREQRERELAAVKAVWALPVESRRNVLAELIKLEEATEANLGAPKPPALVAAAEDARGGTAHNPSPASTEPVAGGAVVTCTNCGCEPTYEQAEARDGCCPSCGIPIDMALLARNAVDTAGKFVDKAERFVLGHPDGMTTAEVAAAIGQKTTSADGTLRLVCRTRKTIARAGRKWVPADRASLTTKRATIRDLIKLAFAFSPSEGASTADVFREVQSMQSDASRASVEAELSRMRKEKLVVAVGNGPHGGGLYDLAPDAVGSKPTNGGRLAGAS